jgi:hypothetical protein
MGTITIDPITLQRPLFQFLTVFNGYNLGQVVWEQYQQFAVPKIENATKDFAELVNIIPLLTPKEASDQLSLIGKVIPMISELRSRIEKEKGEDFQQFKTVTLGFFAQLEHVNEELIKASNQSDNARSAFHYTAAFRKNPAMAKYLK